MSKDIADSTPPRALADDASASLPAKKRQTSSLRATRRFTQREKILLAAMECSASSKRFTTDGLVLRVWQLFPEPFSLGGTALAHPDSNRVLAKLAGAEGLRGLGWVELVETSTYRVTRKGRRVAEQFSVASDAPPELPTLAPVDTSQRSTTPRPLLEPSASKTARPTDVKLAHVPSSTPQTLPSPSPVSVVEADIAAVRWRERSAALRKFLRGSPLSFADACSFWGITAGTPNAMRHIAEVGALLERVTRLFDGKGAVDSRLPPLSTCYGLLNLHRLMLSRFARERDALAPRSGV